MLVSELENEGKFEEAASILEDRGYLLEATSRHTSLSSHANEAQSKMHLGKAAALRIRNLELITMCKGLSRNEVELLFSLIDPNKIVSENDKCALLLSKHLFHDNITGSFKIVASLGQSRISSLKPNAPLSGSSILWRVRALEAACKLTPKHNVLENLPGKNAMERLNFLRELVRNLKNKRTPGENLAVIQTEAFFDLEPKQFDPNNVETRPLINLRLREVLHDLKCKLPISIGADKQGFKVSVDRGAIHLILSTYLAKKAAALLILWHDTMSSLQQSTQLCIMFRSRGVCNDSQSKKIHSHSPHDLKKYIDLLQMQIRCFNEISNALAKQYDPLQNPWVELTKRSKQERLFVELTDILCSERQATIIVEDNEVDANEEDDLVIRQQIIDFLYMASKDSFFKKQIREKREDIRHAMKYHRVLSLCKGKQHACAMLDIEMNRIEKRSETFDARRRKLPYCINNKGQIFPRLWLWATETAEGDGKIVEFDICSQYYFSHTFCQ
jgi:hypothetical protein